MQANNWVRAKTLNELDKKNPLVFRHEGKQISLFKTENSIHACDNRCPHEGYPLSEGNLSDDCILTCNWHNWKFNLKDGSNLFGGDRLRTYPVEVRNNEIWVDITDLPFDEQYDNIIRNLKDGFDDYEYDRIAREIARLIKLGADPLDTLRFAIRWSYDRMEFGWTHAYAGMADWLNIYRDAGKDSELKLVCLVEGVAHTAFDVLREEVYPYTENSEEFVESVFLQAIEDENEELATAMVRGGIEQGMKFNDFERPLSIAALAHYNDFGHSLIYIDKTRELVSALGEELSEPLLLSLVREIVYATREDKIPEFRNYQDALSRWGSGSVDRPDYSLWLNQGINSALNTTVDCSTAPPESIHQELLVSNAINMLQFDLGQQKKVRIKVAGNVDWLDFTHALTFGNAVRKQCTRFPELWPQGLLQMACFMGRNSAFTTDDIERDQWTSLSVKKDIAAAREQAIDHGQGEHIVSVHMLKTMMAVAEEADHLPDDKALYLTAALNRFLNSPLKRRYTRRTAHQSIKFVEKE